jgi:hypothetical protein
MSNDETDSHEKAEGIEHEDETDEDFTKLKDVDDCCENIELEHPECEFDNHIGGVVTHGDSSEWPVVEALLYNVNDHGEVHATVEEHDKELEIRQGTAYFDFKNGVIRIATERGFNDLVVSMDRIVDWYTPLEAWH